MVLQFLILRTTLFMTGIVRRSWGYMHGFEHNWTDNIWMCL
jgi:hypothetical protein